MPLYEIFLTEQNEGYVNIEADSEEAAWEELYSDFDWSRVNWVSSEIVNTEIELVEE